MNIFLEGEPTQEDYALLNRRDSGQVFRCGNLAFCCEGLRGHPRKLQLSFSCGNGWPWLSIILEPRQAAWIFGQLHASFLCDDSIGVCSGPTTLILTDYTTWAWLLVTLHDQANALKLYPAIHAASLLLDGRAAPTLRFKINGYDDHLELTWVRAAGEGQLYRLFYQFHDPEPVIQLTATLAEVFEETLSIVSDEHDLESVECLTTLPRLPTLRHDASRVRRQGDPQHLATPANQGNRVGLWSAFGIDPAPPSPETVLSRWAHLENDDDF